MAQSLLDMIEDEIAIAQDTEFATESIPCPALEAPASIKSVRRSSFTSGEDTYFTLQIRWEIDSEEAREETRMDKVFVDQSIFLNLDHDSCLNMEAEADQQVWVVEKDSNPEFGRLIKWLKSTGWEMPSGWIRFWSQLSDDIVGKEALVKVKQRPRKTKELGDDGEPVVITQAYIASIAKA
jgi:hypothetical protein